jgi:hypothetical protein
MYEVNVKGKPRRKANGILEDSHGNSIEATIFLPHDKQEAVYGTYEINVIRIDKHFVNGKAYNDVTYDESSLNLLYKTPPIGTEELFKVLDNQPETKVHASS